MTGNRVDVTRVYHFSAAHRLESPALSPEANATLYGLCHRPHGHNYYVEVTVTGAPDPLTGMAVDLGRLDTVVRRSLLDQVDHRVLEEALPLRGVVTTGEGLARAFWRLLAPAVGPGALTRIAVVETAKNRFEYRGEDR
ncbi:MAG: 6-carboxytetrahydropterin synthase [Candidatus Rokubacteria bacterium]|nr:6-carboxytetrahydropterin synthase [Candidatus Rokubacteria bacterium]